VSKKTISLKTIIWIICGGGGVLGVIAYITTIIVNSYTIKKTFLDPKPTSLQPLQTSSATPQNPEIPTPKKSPTSNFTRVNSTTSVDKISTSGESLKPSPEQMVRDYYSTIINGQYKTAWNQQSEKFKINKLSEERVERRDYNFTTFRDWWQKVDWCKTEKITLIESSNEKATLDVKLQYQYKTGRLVNELLRLILVWDAANNKWLIDKSTHPPKSEAPKQATSTPSPSPTIPTEQVNFTPNDPEIQLNGSVSPNQKKRYLIHRTRGQKLAVKLLQGNVSFVVIDPAGQMSDRITKIGDKFEPQVRRDGDYVIEISSRTTSDYVVSFELRSQDIKPPVAPSIVAPKLGVRSQPSPSPTIISKPSAEQIVRDYYSTINNRDYETAWQQQSDKFKANKTPKRPNYNFQIFRNWWEKEVSWVKIKEVKVVKSNSDKAIVYVRLKYEKKSGRLVDHPLRLSLIWDAKNRKWLIDESETLPD